MIKRKEEATIAAREEIKSQTLREMQLQSEVCASQLTCMNKRLICWYQSLFDFIA